MTIQLAELTSLGAEELNLGFTIETTEGDKVKIRFSSKALQDMWLLAIDGTCTKSYDMHFLGSADRAEMSRRVSCGRSDCEISRTITTGEEEAWIFQFARNAVIPLSINRIVECSWDGLKYATLPLVCRL